MSASQAWSRLDPFLPPRGMGWLMSVTTGIMVFITVMAVFLSSVILQISERWSDQLIETSVIRLPFAQGEALEAMTDAVGVVLSRTPGVLSFEVVSPEALEKDLSGWLGDPVQIDQVTLPRMIKVYRSDAALDLVSLRSQLDAVAPGTVFDDYSRWREPLRASVLSVRVLAFGVVALLVFALGVMIWLSIRTALFANASIINLLSDLGARESYIRRGILRRYLRLVGIGAVMGALAGASLVFIAPDPARENALLSDVSPTLAEWTLIGAVPVSVLILAYTIIRQTISEAFSKAP